MDFFFQSLVGIYIFPIPPTIGIKMILEPKFLQKGELTVFFPRGIQMTVILHRVPSFLSMKPKIYKSNTLP